MPQIEQLSAHVADLIAAGEVVERPASVVKELVENAIDAGASVIAVETQRGGMGLIRVSDNGGGISGGELPTAFLRHATSKLKRAEDLEKIGTLGFRGEALAAIAAVSRVDVLTRRTGEATGSALHLEGGVPGAVTEAGAPEGSTLVVRDLFYNTPARLKFMRRDSAETAAVNGLMQHLALSHPDVSFRYLKDGVEALHTPGDSKLDSAIYAALGRDFARGLTAVEGRRGDIAVKGFVTAPLMGRGSRGMQIFFVNGRFIKSQLLTAALEEAYRNQMMKGKFPGCVLAISLPVTAVDVNVHPAKTQVKFAREREVFDAVYHTVQDGVEAAGRPLSAPPPANTVVNPRGDFYRSMDAKTFRETAERTGAKPAAPGPAGWNTEWKAAPRVADAKAAGPLYQTREPQRSAPLVQKSAGQTAPVPAEMDGGKIGSATLRDSGSAEKVPAEKPAYPPAIPAAQQALKLPEERFPRPAAQAPWRIAGEVLRTYIICEAEDQCVWLIDKHAAHERVNFDRLQAAQTPPMRQTLLRPLAAELEREDGALLLENLPLLEQFGFACEEFGQGALLVREVPSDIDAADTVATLEEFAEALRTGRDPQQRREALLHTMACKAAIKAGMHSDERELRVLVDRVQSGEIQYCPHGRPVAVQLTKYELEKMFKRA